MAHIASGMRPQAPSFCDRKINTARRVSIDDGFGMRVKS